MADNNKPMPSATDNIVEIPHNRRHDSGTAWSIRAVLLALAVAIVGSAGLGAGYGAVIALCGEKYVNIGLACTFPFWMAVAAHLGFMWSHLQHRQSRRIIELVSIGVCFYAVCVGWVFAVLDGPGLVLNPIELARHLADVSVHSLWATDYRQDLIPLAPWLLTLRFGSLAWLLFGSLMSIGGATPYPYCQECRRWMQDEATLRLHYDPPGTEDARRLAADLVAGQYEPLYALDQPLDDKAKGLNVSVYSCEACNSQHVLEAVWFRPTPDPDKNDTEQLLESGTGRKLVGSLIVPAEVQQHIARLEQAKAA
jgi:hypothetical protein